MNISNTTLDLNFVRSQFPAFNDEKCKEWAFFENAGGSYVPKQVIEKLNKFMISTKVQPYAEYSMSRDAGEQMDKATEVFAKIINAEPNEVLIGGSTSINLYVLSNALKSFLKSGDEIIVTNQDHEANISPWRRLSDSGAIIKEWEINTETGELDFQDFEKLLSKKTKIVAVTHCSNIVGSVNNLKKIVELSHSIGAIVIGDGVSFAPHGFPDVKDIGVDFYTFSLYKTYGPHLALLYGKKEILEKLPNQNHEFLEGNFPYTINPGGPNHEELASLVGIYDYLMDLYKHHFNNYETSLRNKIIKINNLISNHEQELANPLLRYLSKREDFRLIGKNIITNQNRAPTISFTNKNISSKDLSSYLVKNKIATRNDNFYAWRCLKALKINTEDGVVRISIVHYNTKDEINRIIDTFNKI